MVFITPIEIVTSITEALGEFVRNMAGSFVDAFQRIFMNSTVVDGVETFSGLSSVGIFLLVMLGVSLGYGIIRYVTGLFRREA